MNTNDEIDGNKPRLEFRKPMRNECMATRKCSMEFVSPPMGKQFQCQKRKHLDT